MIYETREEAEAFAAERNAKRRPGEGEYQVWKLPKREGGGFQVRYVPRT